MSFLAKCEEYFNSRNFYEILSCPKDANGFDVRMAYYKVALPIHPDRVEETEKALATQKFKYVSKIYNILEDKSTRKNYDESGSFDKDHLNVMEYWLTEFANAEMLANYVNSEKELEDIKKTYCSTEGNMSEMLALNLFLDVDHEERIIEIVRKLVDDGKVPGYNWFFNEPEESKLRRRNGEENFYTVFSSALKKLEKVYKNRYAKIDKKYYIKEPSFRPKTFPKK